MLSKEIVLVLLQLSDRARKGGLINWEEMEVCKGAVEQASKWVQDQEGKSDSKKDVTE